MQPNTNKIKESLLKHDGTVEVIKEPEKAGGRSAGDFSKHLFALYSLLVLSFTLHLYVILNNFVPENLNLEKNVPGLFIERGRRSVEERDVDASQLSTANVEFIHPKLRDDMKEEEDPENPFVWLNSYSRVPVSYFTLRQNLYQNGL